MTVFRKAHPDPICRRGVVLIVVTIVIVLVSLAAYGFVALMQTENKAAHLRGDQLQAENVAASGLEFVQTFLLLPREQRAAAGGLSDNPALFQARLVDGLPTDSRQGRFCVLSPRWDDAASTTVRFGVEHESAKLHLGILLEWDKKTPGSGRAALMNLPGMTETTADSLLDWMDEDSAPRELGAESDYYLGLDPPYRAANAGLQSLEELLLVKGVTRDLLFGLDLNVNYRVDPFEAALAKAQLADRSIGQATEVGSQPSWSAFLTLHSAERNESFQGRPRIYLNQRDLPVLHQQLVQALDVTWANFIIAYRQYGPDDASSSGDGASSFSVDLSQPAKVDIQSPLDLVGATVKLESSSSSSESPQIIASPLTEGADATQSQLMRLCDGTTTDAQTVIRGRVNINRAPPQVLASVPGIDAALVERITAAKSMSPGSNQNRLRHAVWLLNEGLVDLPTMKRLLPYVTTGGDVAKAQIVGFYAARSPWMRVETILDGTSTPARRVYYKNLRNLGRGFSLVQLVPMTGAQESVLPPSLAPATPPTASN